MLLSTSASQVPDSFDQCMLCAERLTVSLGGTIQMNTKKICSILCLDAHGVPNGSQPILCCAGCTWVLLGVRLTQLESRTVQIKLALAKLRFTHHDTKVTIRFRNASLNDSIIRSLGASAAGLCWFCQTQLAVSFNQEIRSETKTYCSVAFYDMAGNQVKEEIIYCCTGCKWVLSGVEGRELLERKMFLEANVARVNLIFEGADIAFVMKDAWSAGENTQRALIDNRSANPGPVSLLALPSNEPRLPIMKPPETITRYVYINNDPRPFCERNGCRERVGVGRVKLCDIHGKPLANGSSN